jgi:hypothetical protein
VGRDGQRVAFGSMIDLSLDDLFPRVTPIALDVALPRRPHKALVADKVLSPVRPNLGLQAAYRKRLTAMLAEMDNSLRYWLEAAYKANPPEIAQDQFVPSAVGGMPKAQQRGDKPDQRPNPRAAPASIAQDELSSAAMRAAMRKLSRRWLRRFDDMAEKLAAYFAQSVSDRADGQLRKILKDGGFAVDFTMSPAQRDVLNATVNENVALIKSIPREYLSRVEGHVMRSVQTGRDMKQLSDDLQRSFGVSKRRAAIISRDQNNKATAMLTRARHLELGITENVWVHSRGGKVPRPTHVKASAEGVLFDVAKGWYDPAVGEYIWPGTLINCRCVGRPVIKALGR